MQVTETETDGLKREFKVVIAASDIEEKLEHRLMELGSSIKVPGFRPGKVPVQVLKQRFGRSVLGEVVERAVTDGSSQALSERGLRPATQPRIEITSFDEGKDLEFTMALELLPEINPIDFGDLKLTRLKVEVADSEVDGALDHLAGHRKESKPLEKPRKAESGDVLVIDFRGSVNGEELPGMAAEDHHLELGSSSFIEGFEDQLVGVEVGEERQVKVRFPDGYVNEKLAGQEAVFEVKVKEIRETVPATVDDDFAKALGEDSLDSLKTRLRDQIGQDYEQASRTHLKRELLDKLAEAHDFVVPAGMVDVEFETIWPHIEEALKSGELDEEDQGKSEEELKAEYREIAERRVRLGLLLSEVGRMNNIDVSAEELNRALAMEARKHPGKEREVFDYFQRTPEAMANLRAPIFENKVVDFIVEMADTQDKGVTAEELRAELEDGPAAAESEKAAKGKTGSKAKSGSKKAVAEAKSDGPS
ncbi:MAG: trigger factor [Kiloniellales bacterium]|nr:trigger factor [Kiloniellales bacterium]